AVKGDEPITYKRKQLIEQIKPHKKYFTTFRDWDHYAKQHNLPRSYHLRYLFGTWEDVKAAVHQQPKPKKQYTADELILIARQHEHHFTSRNKWDEYAKKHGLPPSHRYIGQFGSWKHAKREKRNRHLAT
ncbi:hypothetical protein ACTWQB_16185, partial [Piscibacillus sp. B03]|uniref:hypothetical protein n=1 Tax=Piscibacillus sp. B03 TaxID=3457430 RepID=UPI003FCDFB65